MKYSININQKALFESGLQDRLNITDLAIFDVVSAFMSSNCKMKRTSTICGIEYVEIKLALVQNELPVVGNFSRQTFHKRMTTLCDCGLLSRYENNQTEGRSLYSKGPMWDSLIFDWGKKDDEGVKESLHPLSRKVDSTCKLFDTPPVKKSLHHDNTIYDNTNDITKKESKEKSNGAIAPAVVCETKILRFVKPTIEEVKNYCDERHNGINPESFINFYESKGWKVGSSPMKNWKAAIRTWEDRHKEERKEVAREKKDNTMFFNDSVKKYDDGLL